MASSESLGASITINVLLSLLVIVLAVDLAGCTFTSRRPCACDNDGFPYPWNKAYRVLVREEQPLPRIQFKDIPNRVRSIEQQDVSYIEEPEYPEKKKKKKNTQDHIVSPGDLVSGKAAPPVPTTIYSVKQADGTQVLKIPGSIPKRVNAIEQADGTYTLKTGYLVEELKKGLEEAKKASDEEVEEISNRSQRSIQAQIDRAKELANQESMQFEAILQEQQSIIDRTKRFIEQLNQEIEAYHIELGRTQIEPTEDTVKMHQQNQAEIEREIELRKLLGTGGDITPIAHDDDIDDW